MKKFITVTVADGCRAFVPIDNIEYVAELRTEYSKATIYFINGSKRAFEVRETFEEIVAKIEEVGRRA